MFFSKYSINFLIASFAVFLCVQSLGMLTSEANEILNARDQRGQTALLKAVCKDNENEIEALLAAGADVGIPDANGFTPLMAAASECPIRVIRLLGEHGALKTINAMTSKGETAVSYACKCIYYIPYERVTYFIEKGADLRIGKIPLKSLVVLNNPLTLNLLLSLRNDWGQEDLNDAHKCTKEMGFYDMKASIERYLDKPQ